MKAVLAVLSVAFFQLIYIDSFWGGAILGEYLFHSPLVGLLAGVVMATMAAPCFGKQTPYKRRLSLLGGAHLLLCWLIILMATEKTGGTKGVLFTSIPFLATCLPLGILRLRQDPAKEDAARKARDREEKRRVEDIRSALGRGRGSP